MTNALHYTNIECYSRVKKYGLQHDDIQCEKLLLYHYEPDYFRLNWSLVGVFLLKPHNDADQASEKCNMRLQDIRGKAIKSGNTVVSFTKDMWLV